LLLRKAERRYNLHTADYARLAAFRQGLREFLRFSEGAAEHAGLLTQHYQAMLIVRACPEGLTITINDLARQLLIKHNSAVGLVDRLAKEGLVKRAVSATDRRKVELQLSARSELERIGPELKRLIAEVLRTG
jgi:DNA-binding MarR family transcriptional regulator